MQAGDGETQAAAGQGVRAAAHSVLQGAGEAAAEAPGGARQEAEDEHQHREETYQGGVPRSRE